jgi:dihydroxycyclohexadiene carboxylate dehydrogenase
MQEGKLLEPRAEGARRFAGKIAIVAGGGQGIGSATARRLAQEGAAVMVGDIVQASAERVCVQIQEFGGSASIYVGDLSRQEHAQGLMAKTKEAYGRIDVLVNIVGGTIWSQRFQHYQPDQVEAEVRKSFWPPLWLCWAVLPYMIEQRSGAIVNLGSHAVVSVDRVPYAASKGAVMALTTSLAKEVAQYGIRVNCVAPHATAASDRVTPRNPEYARLTPEEREARERVAQERRMREIPLGRQAQAEEQAAAIAFLASEDASFITGQVLAVAGGATVPF